LIVAECQAIRAASRRLRELDASIRILVNDDAGETYGTKAVADVVEFYNTRRWLSFDLVTGKVDAHHPMWEHVALTRELEYALEELADDPEYPDLLGLDHYITSDRFLDDRTDLYPPEIERRRAIPHFVDVEVARVQGLEVDGFYRSLKQTWERYDIPLALTEVHIGGEPDDEVAWWAEAWQQAGWAVDEGMTVEGVTSWAAVGGVDWNSLLCREEGWYRAGCFDVRSGLAVRTPLGEAVAATTAGRPIDGLAPGWWREPDRVLPVPAPDIAA
jgi:dTDP-4-dehydrorhamnose reductase